MLGAATQEINQISPGPTPVASPKASPRPYQLPEKLVTISKFKLLIH